MEGKEKNYSPRHDEKLNFLGVLIPLTKNLQSVLPILYGIGKRNVFHICKAVGLDVGARLWQLTEEQLAALRNYIGANYKIEGTLKADIAANIKNLVSIGCYRGIRHKKGLPVRGQRTRTNARTRRGRKKQAVAQKKQPAK